MFKYFLLISCICLFFKGFSQENIWKKRQEIEKSLVLTQNQPFVPMLDLDQKQIGLINLTNQNMAEFERTCKDYAMIQRLDLENNSGIKKCNVLIICILENDLFEKNTKLLQKLNQKKELIFVKFTNSIPAQSWIKSIISVKNSDSDSQNLAAQMIFGGLGYQNQPAIRLKYTVPEELNIKAEKLKIVDSLANVVINIQAAPSCQIMAIKNGKVFYRKSFGFQTYDSLIPATIDDVYDLASLTKVTAALPALMKLCSDKKLDIDKNIGFYLKSLRNSNKDLLKIRDLLTHQAKLKAWIPFWKQTLDSLGNWKIDFLRTEKKWRFKKQIANHLFIKTNFYKKILQQIKDSELLNEKKYVYSDLSFYWYPFLVEKLEKRSFEKYLQTEFYRPLGANFLGFNPLQNKNIDFKQIIPTENDSLFRKQLIHGFVHDEGAALMGGISGHAGLFGSSNDLAKLLEMYLKKGKYGKKTYIKEGIFEQFTTCQFCPENRRALGFDRPQEPQTINGNTALNASKTSFGHTGFTGNMIWVDPEKEFIYIFLSNRVYPKRTQEKLYQLNLRTKVQQAFYDALKDLVN